MGLRGNGPGGRLQGLVKKVGPIGERERREREKAR